MILLALGSNLGDRAANLGAALTALQAEKVSIRQVSPVYETAALLPENAPAEWDIAYYNIVCEVQTHHAPHALLALAKELENRLGRKDIGRWGPRIIDIDILAHGAQVVEDEVLTLPHPGLLLRDFVLLPLQDIAPHWRHPLQNITCHEAVKASAMSVGLGIIRLPLTLRWSSL